MEEQKAARNRAGTTLIRTHQAPDAQRLDYSPEPGRDNNRRKTTMGVTSAHQQQTVSQNLEPAPMHDMDPMLDEQRLATSMNQEFNSYKMEQRNLLDRRNQIQKRIESMRREYDFIQNLDAKDVNYVKEKKLEHAVLLVQRNWRRIRAAREFRKAKLGMRREEHDFERTEEDFERIKLWETQYQSLKETYEAKHKDRFWEKITDERKKDLKEQVIDNQKKKSDAEISKLHIKKCNGEFNQKFDKFNDDFAKNDNIRHNANYTLTQTRIMQEYLVDYTQEELDEASELPEVKLNKVIFEEDKQINDDKQDRAEMEAAMAALDRIKRIRVYSEIPSVDNFTAEEKMQAKKQHKERMARERKGKGWQAWIEPDENDIEADRLISEIKNFKNEHFWNTSFYK